MSHLSISRIKELRQGTLFPSKRSHIGFTLIEVLLAIAMGSVLLVALATSTSLYGNQVSEATKDLDNSLETALEEINGAVDLAWIVEQPASTRLVVTDAGGLATTYQQDGSTLQVVRPRGASGVLLTDVSSVNFRTQITRRLRDTTPVDTYGPWYDNTPKGAPLPMVLPIRGDPLIDSKNSPYYDPAPISGLLLRNDAIALSFTIPAAAPAETHPLPDVVEEVLTATLERILLPVSHLPVLPPIPVTFEAGGHILCHYPPGNPRNSQILKVSGGALNYHLAHGDTAGECAVNIDDEDLGSLTVAVYESGGTDDGVPLPGGALAFLTLPASSLPKASWRFTGIVESPLQYIDPKLEFDAPVTGVPLDLAALGSALEPGTPFTLVLSYTGLGCVVLAPTALASTVNSGVATRREGETDYFAQAWEVEFLLDGLRTISQTVAVDVVREVTTSITLANGREVTSTSLVTSQTLALNPWFGQIPGELPTLQLMGQ